MDTPENKPASPEAEAQSPPAPAVAAKPATGAAAQKPVAAMGQAAAEPEPVGVQEAGSAAPQAEAGPKASPVADPVGSAVAAKAAPQPEETSGAADNAPAEPPAPRSGRRGFGKGRDVASSLYRKIGGLKGWVRRPIFWLTIVPILLSTLYFGLIATGMYVSEAAMTVHTSKPMSSEGTISLLASSSSLVAMHPDLYLVYEYIRSPDMLRILDSELGLRQHYSTSKADIFSRLRSGATDEELLNYYHSVVTVSLDSSTGIMKLKVRAYDADTAHRLAQKIIKYSEALVNRMSERAVKDTLSLAQSEVERAEARANIARLHMKQFRTSHADFSPPNTTSAVMNTLAGLGDDMAKASAELTQLRSFMREDSPQVVTAKSKVAALSRQIAAEQARITGGGDGTTNAVMQYETLAAENDFAQRMLDGMRQSLEQARLQALSKTRYLEAFVQPNMPEGATYPERLQAIGLAVFISLLFFGLVMLTWAAIKEHTGF